MEITISVSDKTVELIQHQAEEKGKNVDEFIGEFVEENFAEKNVEKRERKHNLLKFAGMFSGGDGKTSENYKKILLDEVDKIAGFTTNREKS